MTRTINEVHLGLVDNGGTVYPTTHQAAQHGVDETVDGMTLLDWFAGQALQMTIRYARLAEQNGQLHGLAFREWVATYSYSVAEAMISEKRRREGGVK